MRMNIYFTPSVHWKLGLLHHKLATSGRVLKKCFSTGHVPMEAALYVHWPYCSRKCAYCNFNKYVSYNVDQKRMTQCLVTETKALLQHSGIHRVNSVFFGGGTPSLADPSSLQSVIEAVTQSVILSPSAEITLEMNPTRFETEKLRDFKSIGINRVSIGVQALNNDELSLLGRQHTVKDSIRCVTAARKLFPGRVSVDVMFGRPYQTLDDWRQELQQILKFCDDHVSLYQLTLEKGTKLFKWVKEGLLSLPDEDTVADMYTTALQLLSQHGMNQYEVSNFAKHQGAECEHNWSYWTGGQYIGVGPGAHGRFIPEGLGCTVREARVQTPAPSRWMQEVEKNGHATRKRDKLSLTQQLIELLASGLRTRQGVSHELWDSTCPLYSLYSVFQQSEDIVLLSELGLLTLDHRGMRATRDGLAVLDSVVSQLIAVLETSLPADVNSGKLNSMDT